MGFGFIHAKLLWDRSKLNTIPTKILTQDTCFLVVDVFVWEGWSLKNYTIKLFYIKEKTIQTNSWSMITDKVNLSIISGQHLIRNSFQTQNVHLPSALYHTHCPPDQASAHLWTESAFVCCMILNYRSPHLHLVLLLCLFCPIWTKCARACCVWLCICSA